MNTINEDNQQRQSRRSFLGNVSTIGVGVLAANMVLTKGASAQAHQQTTGGQVKKNKKMRAIVLNGNREVVVKTVDAPQMEAQTDVLLRLTSTAICGTDLHIYEGRMGNFSGNVIGHEPLGIVEEVGAAVVNVKVGDRVTVPTHICCGFCLNCVRGFTDACLTVNPGTTGGAYGYPGMGGYMGTQAEYARIPFADANCLKLPGEAGDDWENDFVLLADAFPTGWHATELAEVSAGNSVAIFGAGAIGLLAAYSALRFRGASVVYVVDYVPERLQKAGEIGAVPIDFTKGDPVEQIKAEQSKRRKGAKSTYRGEEAMNGVDCGIDAIGFQAHDWTKKNIIENPNIVIGALGKIINATGRLGIVGVFVANDPTPANELARKGEIVVPWADLFKKDIAVKMGRDHDLRYNRHLRDLIIAGQAKPGIIVSHRIGFDAAPAAFRKFDERKDGYIKIVLDPQVKA